MKAMTITIKVQDVTKKMYLRQEIATGKTNKGTKFEVCSVVPDSSLHFKIGEKSYMVEMQDILKAILEQVES